MVAISIQIEGQDGLTWPRWKKLVDEVEGLGFAGLYRSDHFTNARPPDKASLEMVVSLAYLADHTQHIFFGPLVAPLSFRDPTLLARQAAALDDLSDGRMILGLGAGWLEREHMLFGHELGDIPTRMARFEEGLEVITRLLKSDDPVTFEGRFYRLRGATLLPRPQRPGGPRILIGGNGIKRTLPLTARYADAWNANFITPEAFRERSTALDALLKAAGRRPGAVRRSVMLGLFFGSDPLEVDRQLSWRHNVSELADKPMDAVIESIHAQGRALAGTPEHIIRQIQAYASAGVDELMLQWFDTADIKRLRDFGEGVLPRI
ncbi:MAG TPA: TIGR03560 family F420-dependent LLM class oxidoreductase [Ktedonobacteraceae bacterium]|nr:TIGR03560 family F420-dependent LLM class oxidoreductase [Ktedonobacteraceae bacterium]